jgi:RND family efflux transporter MFP subunit
MSGFALLALACGGSSRAPLQRPAPAVTTAVVTVRDVPAEVRSPVDLQPLEQADVGSKTLGYLDAVLVDRGDKVRRGQLVAVVRPSDLPDQLAAARSALAQAQAQASLARANRDRSASLAPAGLVSEQELEQQQATAESAAATLAAARSNVGAVAARMGETRIEAPLDGYVSVRHLDPGGLVGPGSGTGAILTVQRVDTLRVIVPVSERDTGRLRVGQSAYVEVDALPGRRFSGKVVRVAPAFDRLTRTLDAEVELDNRGGELRPGSYGRAAIVTDVHPAAVVIPASTVQISSGRSYVFVLDRREKRAGSELGGPVEARVRRAEIKLGVDGGEWFEVVDGLRPGDEIVTAGMDVLSDGVAVRAFPDVDAFTNRPLAELSE